jgi:hypothetical protein
LIDLQQKECTGTPKISAYITVAGSFVMSNA